VSPLTAGAIAAPLLALCISGAAAQTAPPAVSKFSAASPGGPLPPGWHTLVVSRFKDATDYRLVKDGGVTVVEAFADASASGLSHDVRVDLKEFPLLEWRWKVPALIAGADNTRRRTEDSPARVIVTFEGDSSKLSYGERLFALQMKALTGYDFPYATLMYIWENRAPAGTVIPNRNTSRIKMIVVESGGAALGKWRDEMRNVYEDYRRAFGEDPPAVRSVGIMTDTDNTGGTARAFYGDIAFERAAGG